MKKIKSFDQDIWLSHDLVEQILKKSEILKIHLVFECLHQYLKSLIILPFQLAMWGDGSPRSGGSSQEVRLDHHRIVWWSIHIDRYIDNVFQTPGDSKKWLWKARRSWSYTSWPGSSWDSFFIKVINKFIHKVHTCLRYLTIPGALLLTLQVVQFTVSPLLGLLAAVRCLLDQMSTCFHTLRL